MESASNKWPTILGLGLAGLLGALVHRMSRMSNQISPPQSSSPTPTSLPEQETTLMTMRAMMREQAQQIGQILRTVMYQNYPSPGEANSAEMQMPDPQMLGFDYDNAPLSPEIDAVLEREAEEDRLRALQRERVVLQSRMREAQEKVMAEMEGLGDSAGPWDSLAADRESGRER